MSDIVVGIKLKADGSGLVGQMTSATAHVKSFGKETAKTADKVEAASQQIDKLDESFVGVKPATVDVKKLGEETAKTGDKVEAASKQTEKLDDSLVGVKPVTEDVKKLGDETAKTGAKVEAASKQTEKLDDALVGVKPATVDVKRLGEETAKVGAKAQKTSQQTAKIDDSLIGIKPATVKVKNLGNETEKTGRKARAASINIGAMSAASGKLNAHMGDLLSPTRLVAGGFAALFATLGLRKIIQYSDEMTNLRNQLKLVTSSTAELNSTQSQLLSLANRTRSDFGATVSLYAKLSRSTGELKVSQSQLLGVTRAINQSYQLSGSAAAEAAGSTRQLAQALASGVFRGDEFNSVAEQAPRLLKALSDETGKTTGELRKMAEQGQLTSELLVRALVNQSQRIGTEYTKLAPTIGQANTVIANNFKSVIGTFNEATGASSSLAAGLLVIGDALGDLNNFIASGQLSGYLSALAQLWTDWGETVSIVTDDVAALFANMYQAIGIGASKTLSFLGTAFLQFPQNIRAMIGIIAVELASLVDVGYQYGSAFGKVVGVQLAAMVEKAGVYGKELADIMAFWDGDTYNADAAITKANAIAAGMTNGFLANAEKQVAASRTARLATITDIVETRDAALDSFEKQIAAANALGQAKQSPAANDSNFNVVPINAPANESVGANDVSDSELQKLRESLLTREETLALHLAQKQTLITAAFEQQKIQEAEYLSLSAAANKQHDDQLTAYALARNNVILSSGTQIFGAMASLAETFGGKQSKAFKVMFAVQKGFAIAMGVMNLATAISNASALPFPINIPAMAAAATAGVGLIANIKSVAIGQAHDGLRRNDNEGTYVVRKDEMVLNPKQRENFEQVVENTSGGGGGGNVYTFSPTITIDATNATPGIEQKIRQEVVGALNEYDQILQTDFANRGTRSRLLAGAR